jgi:glutathione S-transferase
MKLYYFPKTRAMRPRWCLEEMGIPYELVRVDITQTDKQEYQNLHPHGKVPVLVDEDVTIFESAAICAYLADKYSDKGLIPAPGTSARAYYYQWLFYAMVTLEPPVEHYIFQALPDLPEKISPLKKRSELSMDETLAWFAQVSEPLKAALEGQDFLVENQFTTADIVTGGVLMWALQLGILDNHQILKAYAEKLRQREAFGQANADFDVKD